MDRPKLLNTMDIKKIIRAGEGYLDEVENAEGGEPDEDAVHYLFEDVMVALYGRDVFKWINEKIN